MPGRPDQTLSAAKSAKAQLIQEYNLQDHPNVSDIDIGLEAGQYVLRVSLVRDEYVYLPEEKFGGFAIVTEVKDSAVESGA